MVPQKRGRKRTTKKEKHQLSVLQSRQGRGGWHTNHELTAVSRVLEVGALSRQGPGTCFYLVGEQVAHLRYIINETSSTRESRDMKSRGTSERTEKTREQDLVLGPRQRRAQHPKQTRHLTQSGQQLPRINENGTKAFTQ